LRRSLGFLLFAITLMAAGFSSASELGDRLGRELKGGWGVLEVEVYSACGGTYSDNHAPLRVSQMDGPFELFDQRSCKVQLMVYVPRELVKKADLEGLLTEVKKHITLYASRDDAELSGDWNGREIEPLPDDYDQTLHRHAVWKAEQTNTAVREGIEHALSEAAEAVEDLDDDADYLAGFGEGAEEMGEFSITSCDSLLRISYSSYHKNAPSDQSRGWRDGWNDGQKLVFHVLLADRLRSCLVPVPAPLLP
jgi:hypothetical protein